MDYQQYKELMISTLRFSYPGYQLQSIINNLVDDGVGTYKKIKDDQVSLKGIKGKSNKIELCLENNDETFHFIEMMEFYKGYRYSIFFTYSNLNENKLDDFALNNENYIINNEGNYDHPLYLNESEFLFIKFHKTIRATDDDTEEYVDVRYPILFVFHKSIGILEARFDKLTYRNDENFYKITMEATMYTMRSKLKIKVEPLESDNVIKYIVDYKKDEVHESVQHVGMSGNKSAVLHAGKDNVMPFIGDLEKILENNKEIFNKNVGTVKCLNVINNYISGVKRFSDYKMRVLTWLDYDINDNNNKNIDLKIIFNYKNTKYNLYNYYNPKITKMERMNYVINYIFKTQGELTKLHASIK